MFEIPPAVQAQLDQEVAGLGAAIDQLTGTAQLVIADMGREKAVAFMTLALLSACDADKAAAIAATALVKLAEACGDG